jgi:hypothetical protein
MAASGRSTPRRLMIMVQAVVTVAAVAALLRLIDWAEVAAALLRVGAVPLLGACALAAVSQVVGAWRLSLILDGLGVRVGLRRSVTFTWVGLFAGNVLPATVGGDALFALLLGRFGFPVGAGLIGLVYNRLVNVAVVLLCTPMAMAVLGIDGPHGWSRPGRVPMPLLAVAAAGLLALAAAAWWLRRQPDRLRRLAMQAGTLLRQTLDLMRRPGLAAAATGLSLSMLALGAWALLWLAHALEPDFPYTAMWSILVIAMAAQILPLSINGIGVQEAVFTVCLVQAGGWVPADAVAFSLLTRLLGILISLPGLPATLRLLSRGRETGRAADNSRGNAARGNSP